MDSFKHVTQTNEACNNGTTAVNMQWILEYVPLLQLMDIKRSARKLDNDSHVLSVIVIIFDNAVNKCVSPLEFPNCSKTRRASLKSEVRASVPGVAFDNSHNEACIEIVKSLFF